MTKTATQSYIRIPREKYLELKQFQKYFQSFWRYFEHLKEIKEAREHIKAGKTISQEKLFKNLKI